MSECLHLLRKQVFILRREEEAVNGPLQRLREGRGLSRKTLARMAGVTSMGIYYIEAGKRSPTIRTLHNLAMALDVSEGDLFGNNDPTPVL